MTTVMAPPALNGARTGNRTGRLWRRPEMASLAFLSLLVVVLAAVLPGFAAPGNLQGIISQVAVIGVVALAVNQVILCGEIDISTGSMLGVTAAVAAAVAERTGGVVAPLAAAVAVGVIVGMINGLLSTAARIPAIIVTLGTMSILRGLLLDQAGGTVFNPPRSAQFLGQGMMPIVILLLVAFAFGFLNSHTSWGRDVFAVGGNARAARLAGLSGRRVRFLCFVAVGVCVGIASLIYVGQVGQVQATAGTGFELQVIAAVVVGGTSISGGRGSTAAPLVGAVLIGVILNALTLVGVAGTWRDFVVGALILLAISAAALRRRFLR